MKTTILSVLAMLWSVIQVQAQIVEAVPSPPTVPSPPASAYNSHVNHKNHVSTNRYTRTTNGKTEAHTDTYASNLPEAMQDDPQRTKTFSKSYGISRNDKINIANVYGSITFKIWEKNEIKIDADIKAWANSDEEAQKLIDDVNITSSKNGDEVVFKASFTDKQGNWGRNLTKGKKWRREVKIHLVVYMPATNPLTVSQQYGNVNLPDFAGPTLLKIQYGNLVTGNLSNLNNFISAQYTSVNLKEVNKATIKQQYGSGLTIASIGELSLSAQYATVRIGEIKTSANIKQQYGSGLSIATAENLDLDVQYAAVRLGTVRNEANIKAQYGSGITIEQIGNLSLSSQYASVKIGKISGVLNSKAQYGGRFSVDQIGASGKSINLDTEHIDVTLGFGAGYSADFNVNTSYGGFRYSDNVSARKVGDDKDHSSSKEYNGTIGKGGSAIVRVNARYGSVVFK